MMKNIVLCGIGGQGTVLASKLIAAAAMKKNIPVMSAETIGMAQRGGSVFSHLRLGETVDGKKKAPASPMIAKGSADIIIGFEPGETVRMLPYLKKDGQVITSAHAIMPVTAALTGGSYDGGGMLDYLSKKAGRLMVVDTDKACEALGSSKVMNVLLLGYAARSGALGLDTEDIKEALKERLKESLWELNFRALEYGALTDNE
ncbi:MAG: indolepyruvate oxidoreductase subunit beta [Lachnospiraceae bacterium]|nr:indolepyruvate oxidoreductase subunit beta [Lachnospiraceae bacterium]